MRTALAGIAACIVLVRGAAAQHTVRGRTVAAENHQPIVGATVYAIRSRVMNQTDSYGRFALTLSVLPDTLVARAIGRTPDTLAVLQAGTEFSFILAPAPVPLASVTVYGEDSTGREIPPGTWQLPRQAISAIPAPVEGDVLRSLALVPAVAFSTPLSAQPMVRGLDPGVVGYRLDGFTLLNPYHIGRILGALAPDAVQSVRLAAAPFGEEWGDAVSAVVDAQLREGGDEFEAGGQLSFVSATAWAGGPAGSQRWFAAGRHAFLGDLPINALQQAPYRFDDFYARLQLGTPARPRALVTAFVSADEIHAEGTGAGMSWGSRLLGVRFPAVWGRTLLDLWGESSAFHADVNDVDVQGKPTDVTNRFGTTALGFSARSFAGSATFLGGAEVRYRKLQNAFVSEASLPNDVHAAGWVAAGFAGITKRSGRLLAHAGARIDADSVNFEIQPRGRVAIDAGRWTLAAAAGRTVRTYQLLTDLVPEPELVFFDVWRPAGVDGAPIADARHAMLEVRRTGSVASVRAGWFWIDQHGAGEVSPGLDSAISGSLRFGRAFVHGLEAEVSTSVGPIAASASYVLASSRRRWSSSGPLIPWTHDRRHAVRAFLAVGTDRRFSLRLLGEIGSPEPVTPILGWYTTGILTPSGVVRDSVRGAVTLDPGQENSQRGPWVGHLDVALRRGFGRPTGLHGSVGLSVLNVMFSRVTRLVPQLRPAGLDDVAINYQPTFVLPPVPTLTLQIYF